MDVGSGNGEKPFAALCLGSEKSYGVEYSGRLVEISKQFLGTLAEKKKVQIIGQDALEVDDSVYQQVDFIYMYSPIKDHELMASLFYKIMQTMQEGDILVEVRMVYRPQLSEISGWEIPELSSLILKKEQGKFYYARYGLHEVRWTALLRGE